MPKTAKKVRKGQSEEEYLAQKTQFLLEGPQLNTPDWLLDEIKRHDLDVASKPDRVKMLHVCEMVYYRREYQRCLELIEQIEAVFGVEDAETAKEEFDSSGKKVKKSAKLERHVVELLRIKEKCLNRVQNGALGNVVE